MENLDYYEAVAETMEGHVIRRRAWDDIAPDRLVFARPEDQLPHEVILNVKSLPNIIKQVLHNKKKPIRFTGYICMYNGDDTVINGWVPSIVDKKAEDWYVADQDPNFKF